MPEKDTKKNRLRRQLSSPQERGRERGEGKKRDKKEGEGEEKRGRSRKRGEEQDPERKGVGEEGESTIYIYNIPRLHLSMIGKYYSIPKISIVERCSLGI